MKRQPILIFLVALLSSILLAIGLPLTHSQPTSATTNLLISAAASLKAVIEDIGPLYQRSHPNVRLSFNFGASGTLFQQIEQGAPVDVFISAASRQMDALSQKGRLVTATRSNLANNRLVMIAPSNSRAATSFASLRSPSVRRISMGEPRSVPAGQYTEQVLRKLNLWNDLQPKLVYANNVPQVLSMVRSGNADAGFLYLTDVKVSNQVRVVAMADEEDHSPIVYPMAVLSSSKNIPAATAFLQYLTRDEAKTVLRRHGFIVR